MEEISGIDCFEKKITHANGITIVDFWGSSCAPCIEQKKIINSISKSDLAACTTSPCQFYSVNIEEEIDIAVHCGIRGLPVLCIFKSGQEKKRWAGIVSKQNLLKELQNI